jgi:hypothetical protein
MDLIFPQVPDAGAGGHPGRTDPFQNVVVDTLLMANDVGARWRVRWRLDSDPP